MDNVAGAVAAYESGDYTGAYDKWNQVLRIDVNYPVANRGIAQALYKDGKMEEAMAYYELADSKDGYGEAFARVPVSEIPGVFWLGRAGGGRAGGGDYPAGMAAQSRRGSVCAPVFQRR